MKIALASGFALTIAYVTEMQRIVEGNLTSNRSQHKPLHNVYEAATAMYDELSSAKYIDVQSESKWCLTLEGAKFVLDLREKSKSHVREDHEDSKYETLYYVLQGFLAGLFVSNDASLTKTYNEPAKIDSRFWPAVLAPACDEIVKSAENIVDNDITTMFGKGHSDVVFETITRVANFPEYYAALQNDANVEFYAELVLKEQLDEDYDLVMFLYGLVISTALS